MLQRNNTLIKLLAFSIFLSILSSCSIKTISNVGQKSVKIERIAIGNQASEGEQWQTNQVLIDYSTENSSTTFSISGTVHIKDSVTYSFPLTDYFHLFLNFLNEDGIVLATSNISPLMRYHVEVPNKLPFSFNLEKPQGSVAFAFNYIGNFKGYQRTGDGMGDWPVYHRPFTRIE